MDAQLQIAIRRIQIRQDITRLSIEGIEASYAGDKDRSDALMYDVMRKLIELNESSVELNPARGLGEVWDSIADVLSDAAESVGDWAMQNSTTLCAASGWIAGLGAGAASTLFSNNPIAGAALGAHIKEETEKGCNEGLQD